MSTALTGKNLPCGTVSERKQETPEENRKIDIVERDINVVPSLASRLQRFLFVSKSRSFLETTHTVKTY